MVPVYKPANAPEAHILKHRLADEGIEAVIFGEALQGGAGELQPMGFIQLMVSETDFQHARALVKAWEKMPLPPLDDDAPAKESAGIFAEVMLPFLIVIGIGAFALGFRL